MKTTLTLLIAAAFAAFYFGFISQPQREGDLHRAATENRTAITDAIALFNQPQP